VNLDGLRIGAVGTGSSGIQVIPELARVAAHLTVFQRTPNFSFPARNRPLNGREIWQAKAAYPAVAEQARTSGAGHYIRSTGKSAKAVPDFERRAEYERAWQVGGTDLLAVYNDTLRDLTSNGYLADFVREKIRSVVASPDVAQRLVPIDHPVGAKRPCVDTDYYETFNRENVELVDLRTDAIIGIERQGLRTEKRLHEVDVLVFATGYDAMTGPLTRLNIRDVDGVTLAERWRQGPAAYLGLAISGCPNMFTITGPGSPSVLVNVIRAIEQHVEWIVELLEDMRSRGVNHVEADRECQEAWAREVDDMSHATVHRHANSWWLGSNIEGKARVFMPFLGGLAAYRSKCEAVRNAGYEGFRFSNR
jgi:cation diffusion facilitator CzcD-associated flavoprotein CzcO